MLAWGSWGRFCVNIMVWALKDLKCGRWRRRKHCGKGCEVIVLECRKMGWLSREHLGQSNCWGREWDCGKMGRQIKEGQVEDLQKEHLNKTGKIPSPRNGVQGPKQFLDNISCYPLSCSFCSICSSLFTLAQICMECACLGDFMLVFAWCKTRFSHILAWITLFPPFGLCQCVTFLGSLPWPF